MSGMASSWTPSVQLWDDQVSSNAPAEQLIVLSIIPFVPCRPGLSNLFNEHECNVVGCQTADRKTLNRCEQLLLELQGAAWGFRQNDIFDVFFTEHFALDVLCFRQAIRVGEQHISFV